MIAARTLCIEDAGQEALDPRKLGNHCRPTNQLLDSLDIKSGRRTDRGDGLVPSGSLGEHESIDLRAKVGEVLLGPVQRLDVCKGEAKSVYRRAASVWSLIGV